MATLTIDFRVAMIYDIFRTFTRTNVPPRMKGDPKMKEKYIEEINNILINLDENKLLYILTFIKKVFGSH